MSDNVPRKSGLWVRASAVGLMSIAGGLGALVVMPEPQAKAAAATEVLVAGELAPAATAAATAAFAQRWLAQPIALRAGGERVIVRRGELGAAVDADHLAALLSAAADARSAMRRVHAQVAPDAALDLPIPSTLDEAAASPFLLELKDRIDRPAEDAHVDTRNKTLLPGRAGVALDVQGSLDRIERALSTGQREVELATAALPPRLMRLPFDQLRMGAVLGEMATRYARGPETRDRAHNLRVAARKIDGIVLAPGETFDFNARVGDRTAHNGFRIAPVIADGELVDGVGGGTCQIASTLHAAVFFAGLPILERTPHSHPSYYIKLGLDAAVAYGSLNFRFRNDLRFPVVIEATVEDGFVRVALLGEARERTVTFLRRVDETAAFEERFEQDPSLPSGLRVLQQRGVPGFTTTTFRVVKDERSGVARRERGHDLYPPTAQIWRIGTGTTTAEAFVPPRGDGHPEYLADELLIATQGPSTRGIEVTATAGRTGTPGWILRENLVKPAASP